MAQIDVKYEERASELADSEFNIEKIRALGKQGIIYQQKLFEAFKQDCCEFLLEFVNKETYKFQAFAKVWRLWQFEKIFENENNEEHLVTFLENCFFQLKKYIVYSENQFAQAGAFYMMYGLYYTQPKKELVKIRWTSDEYKVLTQFLRKIRNESNEVLYIFHKMDVSKVFLYVAETRRWGMEPKFAYCEKQLVNDIEDHTLSLAVIDSTILNHHLYGISMLKKVNKEYSDGIDGILKDNPEFRDWFTVRSSTALEEVKSVCEMIQSKSKEPEVKADDSMPSKRRDIKVKAFATNCAFNIDN